MTETRLNEILTAHKKWLDGKPGGIRANLYGAYLSWTNLCNADLRGANLDGANLCDAYLSGARLDSPKTDELKSGDMLRTYLEAECDLMCAYALMEDAKAGKISRRELNKVLWELLHWEKCEGSIIDRVTGEILFDSVDQVKHPELRRIGGITRARKSI